MLTNFYQKKTKLQPKNVKQTDCEDDLKKKNIICQFFLEAGHCDDKDCKYSHDMNLEFNVSFSYK